MMCKKFVGFFKENYSTGSYPSVQECLIDVVEYDKVEIVKYLRNSGTRKSFIPGVAFDPVDRGNGPVGRLSIYGDGEWCWPEFLPILVERYNIKLDQSFVENVKKHSSV